MPLGHSRVVFPWMSRSPRGAGDPPAVGGPTGHPAPIRGRATRGAALALALVIAAIPSIARADDDAPAADDPVFEVLPIAGEPVSGRIAAIAADRITIAPAEGPNRDFLLTELVRLSREAPPAEGAEAGRILLPEGDRLARTIIIRATDAAIETQSQLLGAVKIPLDSALGLILSPPMTAEALDELQQWIRIEPRTTEVVRLANDDRVEGSFTGLDERTLMIQGPNDKPMEFDRAGVEAIGMDPALVSYPRPEGPFLEATLTDGSRLGLVGAKLEKGELLADTRFGWKFRAPITAVVRLTARTSAIDYLSERPIDGETYVPYFDSVRPVRIDANVEGRPFRLAGRTYERGLGTESRSLLAYKLKPGDRRFQALVGLDERAGPLGSVVFRVLVDGQPRFTSPAMTFREPPKTVDVDLEGGKLLILITEFGDRGDARDLADWVEARIIR